MESQPLEGVTGARRVIVPWTEANDVWLEWRRRVPETGLWPVVLGSPDEARELLDAMADQRGAGAPGPETADSPDSPPSFEAQIEALGQRWKHELATAEAQGAPASLLEARRAVLDRLDQDPLDWETALAGSIAGARARVDPLSDERAYVESGDDNDELDEGPERRRQKLEVYRRARAGETLSRAETFLVKDIERDAEVYRKLLGQLEEGLAAPRSGAERAWREHPEESPWSEASWPGLPGPRNDFEVPIPLEEAGDVLIALVPSKTGAEVPDRLGFGKLGDSSAATGHTRQLSIWSRRLDAELVQVERSALKFLVARPPETREQALLLAAEVELCCPDLELGELPGHPLIGLATGFVNERSWDLWWD